MTLPEMNAETVAAIARTTGGNFRLLNRVLTQMERIAKINGLDRLDKTVVEAARQSLVIRAAFGLLLRTDNCPAGTFSCVRLELTPLGVAA